MAPEPEDYICQLEAIQSDAREIAAGLTDAQFNWRPEPGRWSIAQCFDHLSVTASRYLTVIDEGIERARARGLYGNGPFRHGWLGNWFARSLEPPVKRKFKAPKAFLQIGRAH